MNKNIIKKHLAKKFLSEEVTPGISVTNAAKKKSAKENKDGVKDIEKKVAEFEKAVKEDPNANQMAPNKFNYDYESEKTYHDQMEIMNGQEMIQYASEPNKRFKERAIEAIEGSSNMGNNPEWANVVEKQKGFQGPEFGKNLVKNIKASFKKRADAEKGLYSFGDDVENESRPNLQNTRFSAVNESDVKKDDNNKPQIKETMKRLKFKNPFNGVGNALKLIPEAYRVNNKIFEMTDGNESYKIRWEGSLNEGKAVVLTAADQNLVNEDINRMKALFGYKSHETLGVLKGKERLDENKIFGDIWNKTKSLMTESEDMEGADAKEGNWDEETKKAAESTKHVSGSVKKDSPIAKSKDGNPDKAVSHAPEAKKPMKSSSGKNIESDAKPKEGHWEDADVSQAPEAKKHVHLKETKEKEKDYEYKNNKDGSSSIVKKNSEDKEKEGKKPCVVGCYSKKRKDETETKEGWMKSEAKEEQEEGKMMDETFDLMNEEPMDEESMMKEYMEELSKKKVTEEEEEEFSDLPSEPEIDDEEGEEPADDSNWAKSDDNDSDEKEPEVGDFKTDLPTDIKADDEEDLVVPSSTSMDDEGFKLFSNARDEFKIMVKGEMIDVPDDEIYTSIAKDKSMKAIDRAEKIYDEMKKYGDL